VQQGAPDIEAPGTRRGGREEEEAAPERPGVAAAPPAPAAACAAPAGPPAAAQPAPRPAPNLPAPGAPDAGRVREWGGAAPWAGGAGAGAVLGDGSSLGEAPELAGVRTKVCRPAPARAGRAGGSRRRWARAAEALGAISARAGGRRCIISSRPSRLCTPANGPPSPRWCAPAPLHRPAGRQPPARLARGGGWAALVCPWRAPARPRGVARRAAAQARGCAGRRRQGPASGVGTRPKTATVHELSDGRRAGPQGQDGHADRQALHPR